MKLTFLAFSTDLISPIGTLLGVILILVMAYFATKFIARSYGGGMDTGLVKVLDKVGLGQDKYLLIVKAGGKNLLLGVTSHNITQLCELSQSEVDEHLLGKKNAVSPSFAQLFAKTEQKTKKNGDTEG